jgi:hypothetical protein
MLYLTTKMHLEDWIIGATYSVKERGGTITLLGKLVDKHLLDGQIVLDFKKEDGQKHLYFVEEGVEYINHILPQEVEATQNTTVPLTSAGLV